MKVIVSRADCLGLGNGTPLKWGTSSRPSPPRLVAFPLTLSQLLWEKRAGGESPESSLALKLPICTQAPGPEGPGCPARAKLAGKAVAMQDFQPSAKQSQGRDSGRDKKAQAWTSWVRSRRRLGRVDPFPSCEGDRLLLPVRPLRVGQGPGRCGRRSSRVGPLRARPGETF